MASKKRTQLSTIQINEILTKESRPVTIDLKNARNSKKGGTVFYSTLIKHNGVYVPFTWKEINVELPSTVPSKEQQDSRIKDVFNSCDVKIRASTKGGVNGTSPFGETAELFVEKLAEELEILLKQKKDGLVSKNKEIKVPLQTIYKDEKEEEHPIEDHTIRINLAFPKSADNMIDADAKPRFGDGLRMISGGKRVPITVPKVNEDGEPDGVEPLMFGNIHRVFMKTSKMNMVLNATVSTSNLGVSIKLNFSSFEINIKEPPKADRFTEDETACLIDYESETIHVGDGNGNGDEDLDF